MLRFSFCCFASPFVFRKVCIRIKLQLLHSHFTEHFLLHKAIKGLLFRKYTRLIKRKSRIYIIICNQAVNYVVLLFRHSHASLLANEGINIPETASCLGHSNIETIWNTYSHLYPREEARAAAVLNKIM